MKHKKIRQREICWKMVSASSSSSSCIQFHLGVQIIFITFFTKHCWHSLFVMGGFLMTRACLQKRRKTLFVAVVVVVVMMGLGFTIMVVVQRIYMQVVRTGWLPEKNGNKRVVNSIMQVGKDSMLEKSGEEEELRIILCWWYGLRSRLMPEKNGKTRIDRPPPPLHAYDWASWLTPLQQFDVMQNGCIVATGGAQPSCLYSLVFLLCKASHKSCWNLSVKSLQQGSVTS